MAEMNETTNTTEKRAVRNVPQFEVVLFPSHTGERVTSKKGAEKYDIILSIPLPEVEASEDQNSKIRDLVGCDLKKVLGFGVVQLSYKDNWDKIKGSDPFGPAESLDLEAARIHFEAALKTSGLKKAREAGIKVDAKEKKAVTNMKALGVDFNALTSEQIAAIVEMQLKQKAAVAE